jgi:2-phospho-L-lactate guanylyltransferase
MTRLAIIIPVKSLQDGKSRLAAALPAQDRHALNLRLLRHTLDQVAELKDIADVHVVSRSPDVLADAFRRKFATCLEPAACDLNGAVTLGVQHARAAGASEAMILPIDLPWLSAAGLRSAIADFHASADVMIVTDKAGDGTNLMLWRPIETAHFQYGVGSAARHAAHARSLGLRVAVREDHALSFDLDTPADLALWQHRVAGLAPRKRLVG